MKYFILLALLVVGVSCSKNSGFSKGAPSSPGPQSSTSSPEVQVDLELLEDGEPVVVVDEVEDADEVVVVDEEVLEAKKCELLSENERQEIQIKLKQDKALIVSLESEKLLVEGYTFSPSNNQNAAVHHEDQALTYQGKKVLKITSRVVFDQALGLGELQVSYRLRESQGVSQSDFVKLASIEGCVVAE